MVYKTYSDGSEFTNKHLAVTLVGSLIGTAAIVAIKEYRMNRFYKKVNENIRAAGHGK